MRAGILIALLLCATVTLAMPGTARSTEGGAGSLTALIESFMDRQFPDAQSRYWILEIGQEATPGELVLDLHAMVIPRGSPVLTESRFLLLVVDGHLQGAQSVPLENEPRCQPEGETLRPAPINGPKPEASESSKPAPLILLFQSATVSRQAIFVAV